MSPDLLVPEGPALDTVALGWVEVCPLARIILDTGVAVRIDGHPVAVFRLRDRDGVDRVLAVDHVDPFTDVAVLARGIVGDVEGEPIVASPLHKQRFSLLDGRCLDDPDVALTTFVTRIVDGVVLVARP